MSDLIFDKSLSSISAGIYTVDPKTLKSRSEGGEIFLFSHKAELENDAVSSVKWVSHKTVTLTL